jgi:hypothetical protein
MQLVHDWGAQPGIRPERSEIQNEFAWGRRELSIVFGAQLSGAARDSGATPTSVLRAGLALGQITASGLWTNYSATATDGSEVCRGFLANPAVRMTDLDGNNQDKSVAVIVGGPVIASRLYGLDQQARAHCYGRFIFDDDLAGNSMGWPRVAAKAADYTVTEADNNTIFTNQGAGAPVTFTLPAIARGLRFRFFAEANQNLIVAAAAADTMVCFGNATADSIAFQTANEIIGGCVEVVANADATKWLVIVSLGAETQTPTIAA